MKELVTPEHYITLLNHELRRHPCFKEDMEFVPVYAGNGHRITGYTLKNMTSRDLFGEVCQKVYLRYQIAPQEDDEE